MPKRKQKKPQVQSKVTVEQLYAVVAKYRQRRIETKGSMEAVETNPEVQEQLVRELGTYRESIARANSVMGL